jgi:hypothetical protein
MLLAGEHFGHNNALELAAEFLYAFDFNAKHRKSLGQFFRGPIEIYVLPEPVKSNFHLNEKFSPER